MRVLVTAASKHGATAEIADAIANKIRESDITVDRVLPETVLAVDAYDAVVIGSGVYAGHWLEPARRLVDHHAAALAQRPVWLFSSGPMGHEPKPEDAPADIAQLVAATGAREHRVFGGQVDRSRLGLGEKVLLTAVRAPEGDFRPWDEIRAWASGIAVALKAG